MRALTVVPGLVGSARLEKLRRGRTPAGTGKRRGQGMGSHRAHRPARALGTQARARDRSRTYRPARCASRRAAGSRRARARPARGRTKPQLVAELGATYHTGSIEALGAADVVLECIGAPALVIAAMRTARANGIVCLTGVSSGGRVIPVDTGELNRELVLENNMVFGSVNANRSHYEQAAVALARADATWLGRLITRRVPLERWAEALERRPQDVKTLIEFP